LIGKLRHTVIMQQQREQIGLLPNHFAVNFDKVIDKRVKRIA